MRSSEKRSDAVGNGEKIYNSRTGIESPCIPLPRFEHRYR